MSDEELIAEALQEAEKVGLDMSYGKIEIGEWMNHMSTAVQFVRLDT